MAIIRAYKLVNFSGLAPCFDDNLFTLATCKPDVRRVIGRTFEQNTDKGKETSAWLLGLVGKDLVKNDPDWMLHADRAEETFFVAKVTDVARYSDYYTETDKFDRQDRIYIPDNSGTLQDKWSSQSFKHVSELVSQDHPDPEDWARDWSQKRKGAVKGAAYVLKSTEYTIISSQQSKKIASLVEKIGKKLPVGRASRGAAKLDCPDDAQLVQYLQEIVSSSVDHGFGLLPKDVRMQKKEIPRACGSCTKR